MPPSVHLRRKSRYTEDNIPSRIQLRRRPREAEDNTLSYVQSRRKLKYTEDELVRDRSLKYSIRSSNQCRNQALSSKKNNENATINSKTTFRVSRRSSTLSLNNSEDEYEESHPSIHLNSKSSVHGKPNRKRMSKSYHDCKGNKLEFSRRSECFADDHNCNHKTNGGSGRGTIQKHVATREISGEFGNILNDRGDWQNQH